MALFPAAVFNPSQSSRPRPVREAAAGRPVERLPFTVRRVETEADLLKAVQIRHAAYSRHVPEFAQSLIRPEQADYDDDTIVLLAESKLDGSPLGSTRIRSNLVRPLSIEESIALPAHLQDKRLVEAVRLGIDDGRVGRLVKTALIKACFMYCQDNGIDYSVAAGRPSVARQYEQLMFVDLFPDDGPIPLRHAGNIPHRIMAFEIDGFEQRWTEARHPLTNFFFNTHHPDIDAGPRKPAPSPARVAPRLAGESMLPSHREIAFA